MGSHFGKQLWQFLKMLELSSYPEVPLLGTEKHIHLKTLVYTDIYSSIIHDSQKCRINSNAQRLMSWWTKCSLQYPWNIACYKNEQSTDTCYIIEVWKHTKRKKTTHKRPNIEWLHLYKKSRIGNFIETESKLVVVRGRGGECGSDG